MSEIGNQLRALADKVDEMAGTPATAPAGVSGAPAPSNAPTPTGAPAKGISAEVSRLANNAMTEALALASAGHNVAGIVLRIEGIKKSTTVQEVQVNARIAIAELEPLHDRNVDVSKLREPLHEIEVMTFAEDSGLIIGDTDVVGDMTT